MMRKLFVFIVLCMMIAQFMPMPAAKAQLNNSNTDWMSGNYGVGFHYLQNWINETKNGGSKEWNDAVNAFDVNRFANDVSQTGAKWVLFTIGQNSGYYDAPNATIDSYSGYQPGERNSNRDLIMDMADALQAKGIKLMLYLPSNAPKLDENIARGFGLSKTDSNGNWHVDETFVQKWAQVIKEYSERYGTKIAGWWFDGFYNANGFQPAWGKYYSDAAKSGNPNSVIALNLGASSFKKASDYQDYLAGERGTDTILGTNITGRWIEGIQWHAFTPFGGWSGDSITRKDLEVIDYTNQVISNGRAITWNIGVTFDGKITTNHFNMFKRIKDSLGNGSGNGETMSAAEVAAAITTISAPAVNAVSLTFPAVPSAFTVRIKSSDNTDVIRTDGSIIPPNTAAAVNLVLEVTKKSDGTKADTASIQVKVPAKSAYTLYEGESYLPPAPWLTYSAGLTFSTANDANASGGKYLQTAAAPKVGDWIEFAVNVPEAGTYNVVFGYKTNNNRGTTQLSIDGKAQGAPVDEYLASQTFTSADLGNITFATAGSHSFRFVVTGKNASSSSYNITWDYLKLVSVLPVIVSIDPVQLDTETETMPELPPFVTAVYSDNSTKEAAVTWDPIDPSQYVSPGSFTVEGTVAGTSTKAVATITVTEAAPELIAERITSIQDPAQGATILALPAVPRGFAIKIKQSDDLSVIKTDGTIDPPSEDKTVNVVLEITRLSDGSAAETDAIPVFVPGVQVSAAPQVTLHVTDSVYAGGPFDLTVGAQHVKGSIYGYDITVHYDSSKVDLLSAEALKDALVIVDTNAVTGQLRILAVAIGDDKAANANGDLLVIHGKAKSLAEPAAVSLSAALVVANGDGAETQLGSASHDLQITYADKAALNALVAEAHNTVNAAEEGTQPGQYPAGSKAVLNAAIDRAEAVASNPSATQQLIDQAAADLSAALQTFLASVITGVPGDINNDGKVSIGDLAIVAKYYGKSSTDADWDAYKFADLNHDGVIDIADLAMIARWILVTP
ncbi:Ig-like domain-containing protein [Paenibacillus planticolens]|uniref:Carbohydrate-binding protein n=1 Tax=Paenibacillus planticolens TaxID=2654976 RepID=A0ABX1ZWI8_9BACL|nr:Ig-like domain-containing protein [Paenibacillus planticolens]NOV04364.1 carbohydrate-binding protein [Paenibacillus planticolens]